MRASSSTAEGLTGRIAAESGPWRTAIQAAGIHKQ